MTTRVFRQEQGWTIYAYLCDLCDHTDQGHSIPNEWGRLKVGHAQPMDICPACRRSFAFWMEGRAKRKRANGV